MTDNYTVLWIGNEMLSPVIAAGLSRAGCRQFQVPDIAEGLQVLRDGEIELIVLESPASCGSIATSRRARDELGWEPRVPLEAGLRDMVAWAKSER